MRAPALQVQDLSCGYGTHVVLEHVSFSVLSGETVVLLGPNGVGKTTLFKTILGFLPKLGGSVLIAGEDASNWTRKRMAQNVAYVPQSHEPGFGYSVDQMVLMGCTPSLEGLSSPRKKDEVRVGEILELLEISTLSKRDFTTLSGGEQQMVLIARALVQQPKLLVMDEPSASLDLGNQVLLLQRIEQLNGQGYSIVFISHDPNHALELDCSTVCIPRKGDVRQGSVEEAMNPDEVRRLYGIESVIGPVQMPDGGCGPNVCVPLIGGKVE